jgi:hypothetical protein
MLLLMDGGRPKGVVAMSFLRSAAVAAGRRLLVGLACAALLLVSGCVGPFVRIHLQMLDFEEVAVQGVGIWRESVQPGQWELVSEIPIAVHYAYGKEWIYYELELVDGTMLLLASLIERDLEHPERVAMRLQYLAEAAGSLRVSAYNAAGHSALSLEEIEVLL